MSYLKTSTSRQPERERQLDVAALYKALVAEYPEKLIILYDEAGLMLAGAGDSRDVGAPSVEAVTGSQQSEFDALQHQHHLQRDRDLRRVAAGRGFPQLGLDVLPRASGCASLSANDRAARQSRRACKTREPMMSRG